MSLIGVVLGVAIAAFASPALQAFLFGIEARDAVAFGVGPVALIVIAVLASLVPARRAGSHDLTPRGGVAPNGFLGYGRGLARHRSVPPP